MVMALDLGIILFHCGVSFRLFKNYFSVKKTHDALYSDNISP